VLGATIGGLTLQGGELLTSADGFVSARTIKLENGVDTLAALAGTTATYTGVVSRNGVPLLIGDFVNNGTVVLSGNNTYDGGTQIRPGTLVAGSDNALGTGTVELWRGRLIIPAGVTLPNPVSFVEVDSGRAGLGGLANGSTEGAEWSTFISGGYDFHFGSLTVGPIAALQYTDVHIDGFSEKGSLAPMQIHSDSAESLRTDVGFRAFYQWQIGKVAVEPSLRAAWEHEYKYSALPISAGFAGIPGPSATFSGPSEGHDSAVVSAGLSAQWTPTISTYVNYDGQLGRGNYDSNAVTGGVRISF
jgi:autotransporter-associated beta strand protein